MKQKSIILFLCLMVATIINDFINDAIKKELKHAAVLWLLQL